MEHSRPWSSAPLIGRHGASRRIGDVADRSAMSVPCQTAKSLHFRRFARIRRRQERAGLAGRARWDGGVGSSEARFSRLSEDVIGCEGGGGSGDGGQRRGRIADLRLSVWYMGKG